MSWRNRRLRLALVVAIAVTAAIIVFQQNREGAGEPPPCKPGKQVEKDAAGTVIRITRTSCG
jgi:hypothetical protein